MQCYNTLRMVVMSGRMERIEEKIVFGIEKLARANRVLLWEVAKQRKLSPIQIQFLTFINSHPEGFCTVNNLAKEFDLSEATVSEAIKSLQNKGFISKERKEEDRRVFILRLTEGGRKLSNKVSVWSDALVEQIGQFPADEKEEILLYLMELLKSLKKAGIISVAKMCLTCVNFERDAHPNSMRPHYCKLTDSPLANSELTIDCVSEHCEKQEDEERI